MLGSLGLLLTLVGVFLMVTIGFSTRNQRWSTTDFFPLVFWILVFVVTGLVIDLLLERLFQIDLEGFPNLIGGIVSGCGIRWYRTRLKN
ncbi:MAG: hypothetical protein HC840_29920 [Leptolyngbyaceae cyanobacterium RM2_2_4]|nr:hypothetical protein [Leptolyngbyaceae cyanobacterium SM1_4_3]NJO52909.1 hypothetical protein [Leptolyngbyaceae cyanobacterium RM2_2_4]